MFLSDSNSNPETTLTRRAFATAVLALPLVACQDSEVVSIRFRVIATVEYKGQVYEASSVMECRYWRVKGSLTGRGGGTKLFGEALIFDLPDGAGTFYVLPYWRDPNGGLKKVYERGLLTTFGVKSSLGSLLDEDFKEMRAFVGRKPFSFFNHMPEFVSFQDEKQPPTIFAVTPANLEGAFPTARFLGLDIEITKDPVTAKLRQRLPWLNSGKQVFDRDPPGKQRPSYQVPIGYVVTTSFFFGDGNW